MSEQIDAELLDLMRDLHKNSVWDRFWGVATKLAVTAVIGLFTWILTINDRLLRLEEHRFTPAMARELEDRIYEKMPPRWLKDALMTIQSQQKEIKTALDQTKERLVRLEERGK